MEQGEQGARSGGRECDWQVDFRELSVLQFFRACKARIAAGDPAHFQLQAVMQIDELRSILRGFELV